MAKSSEAHPKNKAKKPYDDFPLTIRTDGRLSKKHHGRVYYFGSIEDWEAAIERYQNEWPYILKGRTPPSSDAGDGCTIAHLSNKFLTSKKRKLEAGELSARSFQDYYTTCEMLVNTFGKNRHVDDLRPDDFEQLRSQLAKRFGPVTLRTEITRCRVMFKYAVTQRLVYREVYYGDSFARPSKLVIQKAENKAGPKVFEADEIRRIIEAADPVMRALVLLGLNCGFGNTDCSSLPQSAINFETGWADFPRPKTATQRRCPLWPETVKALQEAIALRPKPADTTNSNLCFLTARGHKLVRTIPSKKNPSQFTTVNSLAPKFGAMLKKLRINGRRNRGFYTLRHMTETIGGESKDQVAVDAIMGHSRDDMASVYRERISDERLRAVVDTVRGWLFEK